MRIKTPINKDKIKNHLTYHGWAYALLCVLAIFGWDLIYQMTAPQVPQEKRIDVYVLSGTTSEDIVNAFLKPIWEEAAPEMELVSGVVLGVIDDYSVPMQLQAHLVARDVDIYILTETYFKTLAGQGAFLPLEELTESGALDTTDIDLTKGWVTYVSEYDENDNPVATAQHLYGIPLEKLYGFMNGMLVDNRNLYAAILVNNMNDENVIPFFDALIQAGRGEKEEWIIE